MPDKTDYHSVVLSTSDLPLVYQFKIHKEKDQDEFSIFVKEDSEILPRLRVGNRFVMEYYQEDPAHPPAYAETVISKIQRDKNRRPANKSDHFTVTLLKTAKSVDENLIGDIQEQPNR